MNLRFVEPLIAIAGGLSIVVSLFLTISTPLGAQTTPPGGQAIPAEFRGDWVPATAACDSPLRFRAAAAQLTLINRTDTQTWGNLGVPAGFFGPTYKGISVVALPEYDTSQPFTVYFNADEQRGVTKLHIYEESKGPMNAQLAAIQAAAKKLEQRFPLTGVPLKKCR